ncbi:bifunctional DNA primase/polymerase [Shinella sp. CPCC 101442]|uniref:bifunctional DNA primase/polymerase n=1 Tax=Shinella sp. CPCC 101442 TaxID=2932265 RepID=UPI002152B4CC|nr:bifunctional DNA primase/polymerase [Shinella sp. CPCC 101442]MCR6498432.1 bifunctional DNA primase/polymerase [Shinella sp. CPCC 101442]
MPQNSTADQPELTPTEIRLRLLANGYQPIPVDGKRPRISGWSTLHPTPAAIDAWERGHADHQNTGVLTGHVVAVDIDALDPATCDKLVDRLLELPDAGLAPCRTGMAPKTLFVFRSETPRQKRKTGEYLVDGQKCQVEVLGAGQQFVAFGIHPDIQQTYVWSGGDLLSIRFADLPEIGAADLDAFLLDAEDILAAAGTPTRAPALRAQATIARETFWRRVNSAALAEPDHWVGDVFPSAKQEPGTGAWRVSSADLGRGLQEDISIHADGVRDFGTEETETPISIVRKWGGASSPRDAAFWLCERLGRDPSDFGWQRQDLGIRMTLGSLRGAPVAANDDEELDLATTPAPSDGGLPEALCYPPGAVGDFARFIAGCSRFPSAHLSLVASLAFTAGLVGRRYKGPTGLRSNLYVVGLAESGFGKDITIRATAALADSTSWGAKVSEMLFADQIRSLPGLAGKLRKSPSAVVIQDEFGRWLAEHTGRNVASHRAEITAALMELTGAPAGFWGGMEKAGGNIPRIVSPCLTIHGVSTPSTFWNALSSGNISEGLLGRLVLVDVGDTEPVKVRRPPNSVEDIPSALSDQVATLLGLSAGKYTGSFCALTAKSDEKPYPIMTVEWAPGVDDLFEEFDDRIRGMKRSVNPEYRPILNRVGENAARLAMIVAVGVDPKEPVITQDVQEWANMVAEHSLHVILRGAEQHIADNEKAAEYLRVRQVIARKQGEGITLKGILKALRGSLDGRRLDDILAMLRQSGSVHFAKLLSPSGQTKMRFWDWESLPAGAEVIPLE